MRHQFICVQKVSDVRQLRLMKELGFACQKIKGSDLSRVTDQVLMSFNLCTPQVVH